MIRQGLLVALYLNALHALAAEPSQSVIRSCLSAQAISSSVTWKAIPTEKINSQDDYQDGYDAIYYLDMLGKDIGYAARGGNRAIVFDHKIYPVDTARALAGFVTRPTELNPYVAEWGTVKDAKGKFVCISFPYGALGQSGRFQETRSAYLISLTGSKNARVLYFATGEINTISASH